MVHLLQSEQYKLNITVKCIALYSCTDKRNYYLAENQKWVDRFHGKERKGCDVLV